jgi:hypothetical protein
MAAVQTGALAPGPDHQEQEIEQNHFQCKTKKKKKKLIEYLS